MTFEEFKTNVEQWAEARGIYEHSTALAQALKAVSEVGELADAVIKGDREALKDAIGDVAVCLVNVARMTGVETYSDLAYFQAYGSREGRAAAVALSVGMVAVVTRETAFSASQVSDCVSEALITLREFATYLGMSFEECCAATWTEIKGRKGRMVPGGAFVKECDA